jgi:WXG100 family type VII secretion target
MSLIRIDYDHMADTSRQVDALSVRIRQVIATLNTRVAALNAAWDGAAEMAFMNEMQTCLARMAKAPPALDELARDLRGASDDLRRHELQAAGLIRQTISADGA